MLIHCGDHECKACGEMEANVVGFIQQVNSGVKEPVHFMVSQSGLCTASAVDPSKICH